jgi:tetratricopeptide (TPR) repeat protein
MKRPLILACLLSSLLPTLAAAAELIPVSVLPPVTDKKVPEGLSRAIQEKASSLLAGTGKFSITSARQVSSMSARHRIKLETLSDHNVAREAAQRLGVKMFVYSKLTPAKDGWSLEVNTATVGDPGSETATVVLPKGEAAAVWMGSSTLAAAITKLAKIEAPKAQVSDASDAAVKDWAACEALVGKQPIGVENPTVLNEAELAKAMTLCGASVKAAPKLAEAWAALALAAAISGADERAIFSLTQAESLRGTPPMHLPNATLARFWLVTRFQSAEAGETVLKEALAKEPGFLLARGYLAELMNAEGKHAEASKAWQDYASGSPNNPFIISRLAYTLSRLGKSAEASVYAEKALAYDPDSVDLNLELASRYVDANQLDKAIKVLEPLARPADARGETVLRLGYAKLLKGELDEAQKLLTRAHAAAKEPGEWRTRARAKLNLAMVALKKDKKPEAKKLLAEAAKEGLKIKPTDETKDLLALLTPAEVAALDVKPKSKVKEASPFAVTGGEVDPAAARPVAPKGFDDVKVK